jgi:hypothetical protein
MIFWWQGKGWKAPGIFLGTMTVFGILNRALSDATHDKYWFWGLGFLLAAGFTWHIGSRDNQKSISRKMASSVFKRLVYKPRNRFMSLPTETAAVPMALIGFAFIVRDFL